MDELWSGGPVFYSDEAVFKLGSDSVLLADFAANSGAGLACDLGCGGGVLSVLLAFGSGSMRIDAIDISEEAVKLCQRNADANGLGGRIEVKHGDLRRHRELFEAGAYDLVVSNMPYFALGSGFAASNTDIAAARDERECTLSEVCEAAKYLLRWGGRFCVVYRPERLAELFAAMSVVNITPKRLRMVHARVDKAPSVVLVEGRHGGRQGMEILPPLIVFDAEGGDSAEIRRIYRRSGI